MKRLITHRRARIALAFAGTLGVACVAVAIWSGLLQMPFTGSTAAPPPGMTVTYESPFTAVRALNMSPMTTAPPAITVPASWTMNYANAPSNGAENYIRLQSVTSGPSVNWTLKLVLTGTPAPELLSNVHYRICVNPQGASTHFTDNGRTEAYSASTLFQYEGTLTDLSTTGLTPGLAPIGQNKNCTLRIVFWLDPAAPVSIAGQTLDGTFDVATTQ